MADHKTEASGEASVGALAGLQLNNMLASYITEASSRSMMTGEVQVKDYYVDVDGAEKKMKSLQRALFHGFHEDKNPLRDAERKDPLAVLRHEREKEYGKQLSEVKSGMDNLRKKGNQVLAEAILGFYLNGGSGDHELIDQATAFIKLLQGQLAEKDAELASTRTALRDILGGHRGFRSPNEVTIYTGRDQSGKEVKITIGDAQATIDKLLQEGGSDQRKEERLESDLVSARQAANDYRERLVKADAAFVQEKSQREGLEKILRTERSSRTTAISEQKGKYDLQLSQLRAETNARATEADMLRKEFAGLKVRYDDMQDNASHLMTRQAQDLRTEREQRKALGENLESMGKDLEQERRSAQLGSAKMLDSVRQYRDVGQLDEAMTICSTVLLLDPDNIDARFNQGTVYEKQGKLDEAVRSYQAVLQEKPAHKWAVKRIAGIKEKLVPTIKKMRDAGEYQAALDHCAVLEEISPAGVVDALYLRGTVEETTDLPKALRSYQAVIQLKPDQAWAQRGLERSTQTLIQQARELKETDPGRSLEYCKAVLDVSPQNVQAIYVAGTIHETMGRQDIAKACYEQVLTLQPDHRYAQRAMIRVA